MKTAKPATHWDSQRYWQQTDHNGHPRVIAVHAPETHDGYKLFFNPEWEPRPPKEHDYYKKYHPAMIMSVIALFILIVLVSAALHT